MRRNLPRSLWRLFGQHRDPEWRGVPAAEAGFTDPCMASVVINDEYQLDKLQKALTSRERMLAAMGYLMKVTKNGYLAASEYGDSKAAWLLDETCEQVAGYIIIAAERAKDNIRHDLI
jgi:hypothetical protein